MAEKQVIAVRQNARLQAGKTASTLSGSSGGRQSQLVSEVPEDEMITFSAAQNTAQTSTPFSAVPNGVLGAAAGGSVPRSGSFSGIIRSSGSFSRGSRNNTASGIIRSGSLSVNHSGSPALASLLATTSSQLSQSSKDLGGVGGDHHGFLLSTSPSGSSSTAFSTGHYNYKDLAVRQRLITEFATKVAEITCALSTLHSNVSKKISILFAQLNNSVPHLYFFDVAAFKEAQAVAKDSGSGQTNMDEVAASVGRSEYVANILRKVSLMQFFSLFLIFCFTFPTSSTTRCACTTVTWWFSRSPFTSTSAQWSASVRSRLVLEPPGR